MIYYRLAFQKETGSSWQWKSTVLTSLNSVFAFVRFYRVLPQDRIRVFFASRALLLDEMLEYENADLPSNSIQADLLVSGKQGINLLEMQRLEAERGIPATRSTTKPLAALPVPVGSFTPNPGARSFVPTERDPEGGPGGDHDLPYHFIPADTWQEARAWMILLAKVQRGELEP